MPAEKYRVTTEDGVYEVTVGDEPSQQTPQSMEPPPGFFGGMMETLNPFPAMWGEAKRLATASQQGKLTPTEMTGMSLPAGMIGAQFEQGKKALQALQPPPGQSPSYSEAFGHGLAAITPVFGPVAAEIGERLGEGQYARAAGNLMGLSLPGMLKSGKVRLSPKSNLTAPEQAAVSFGERSGIPIDVPTASGSEFAQGTKSLLSKQPLSAGIVGKAQSEQQTALATKGREMAREVAPQTTGQQFEAGATVLGRLDKRITRFKEQADKDYQLARELSAKNVKTVQQGERVHPTEPVRSGEFNYIPVMEDIAVPVETGPVKQALRPLYDNIVKQMDESQRQTSPGFTALRQIMERPKFVPLDVAMADESAIQNLTRISRGGEVEHSAMRDASKGVASAIIPAYRKAIDEAASAADPAILQAINRGRASVKEQHNTIRLLKQDIGAARKEPARVINKLAANDDASAALLGKLRDMEPDVMPEIGRSILEGILEPSLAEGGYGKARSAYNSWARLGPRTKEILFGNKAADLENFFTLGKMLTSQPNPSGSATVGSITAAGVMAITHPWKAGTVILGNRKLAQLLMSPNGPELLRQGFTVPITSPAAKPLAAMILATASGQQPMSPPPGDSQMEPPPGR